MEKDEKILFQKLGEMYIGYSYPFLCYISDTLDKLQFYKDKIIMGNFLVKKSFYFNQIQGYTLEPISRITLPAQYQDRMPKNWILSIYSSTEKLPLIAFVGLDLMAEDKTVTDVEKWFSEHRIPKIQKAQNPQIENFIKFADSSQKNFWKIAIICFIIFIIGFVIGVIILFFPMIKWFLS